MIRSPSSWVTMRRARARSSGWAARVANASTKSWTRSISARVFISPGARELLLDRADLVGEPQQIEVADVLRPDERDRRPGAAGAARSPGPVHVLLGRLGEVEVDDVREVRDVDAARRHVGRHEEPQAPLLGRRHDALAVGLRQIAVQPVRVEAPRLQDLGGALRLVARVAEDDGALRVLDLEDANELAHLVAVSQDVNEVADLQRPDLVARESDELGVAEVALREALDVRRDGRAEEEPLPVLGQELEDGVELAGEAHREHLVGLVEDQDADRGRVEGALTQVIEDAPGGPGDDLGAGLEGVDLLRHRRAAVDGHHVHVAELPELLDLARHLERELAGGAEGQRLDGPLGGADQPVDQRKPEGRRLSGAGAGLYDEAPPLDRRLEDGALYGGGVDGPHLRERALDLRAQTKHVEGGLGGGGCGDSRRGVRRLGHRVEARTPAVPGRSECFLAHLRGEMGG